MCVCVYTEAVKTGLCVCPYRQRQLRLGFVSIQKQLRLCVCMCVFTDRGRTGLCVYPYRHQAVKTGLCVCIQTGS